MSKNSIVVRTCLLLLMLGVSLPLANRGLAQEDKRAFPETGKMVSGAFLAYWNAHGGLAQQGYPISEEFQQPNDLDGKTYTVQYFERAVFERHPENNAPYDVLLSQLGTFRYRGLYPTGAPGQKRNPTNSRIFGETGFAIGGRFRSYWEQHGGLAQQGYPISEEFQEKSDLDGKTYTVQYFERAVFEAHPENTAPYDVLLTQLGTFRNAIREAKLTAATLASPPRLYNKEESRAEWWPNDVGSTTVTYSTCGVMPLVMSLEPSAPTAQCQQAVTLSTQLHSSSNALEVVFTARWVNNQQHAWRLHVSADGAQLIEETGDELPILRQ